MHDNELIELRWDEFRELVDDHFQMICASGNAQRCYAPIIARLFFADDANYAFEHKKEIFAAVVARTNFRRQVPPWVPTLPIKREEIDAMKNSESNIDWLVGIHADSLKWQKWNCRIHPLFHVHACGIMASEHTPDEIRNDSMLQQEFPPKPLVGLDPDLCWHTVDEVVQWREMAIDTIRQGREEGNAHWIRAGTEDLAAADRIYPTLAAPLSNVVPLSSRA